MISGLVDGNPFTRYPILIARMDQLARNDDLLALLDASDWDLVIVDEAHRMSANWWAGELSTTRRYELGQRLGAITRHLLLMTATPHAGSESGFQAFLALLDPDRFEGEYRSGAHTTDTSGLMRRMVKEELLTFEGKPLFPERIAETVPYELSDGEKHLYVEVTRYVREEMNRAERLGADNPRARTVGFALTVLQRRLASSTHAILRSLQRRRERLETKRREMLNPRFSAMEDELTQLQWTRLEDPDELDAEETEQLEEAVVDAATAAQTIAELDIEIAQLTELAVLARSVCDSGEDRKWSELRALLLDEPLLQGDGGPRKLIIFTEHRDNPELSGQPDPQRSGPRRGSGHHSWRHPPGRSASYPGGLHPRPRHPHPGGHRRRRGGAEPASRASDDQLRPAVEPQPHRAAVRAHPPHRPAQHLPVMESGRRRHPRRSGVHPAAGENGSTAPRLRGPVVRRARRCVPRPAAKQAADGRHPLRRRPRTPGSARPRRRRPDRQRNRRPSPRTGLGP